MSSATTSQARTLKDISTEFGFRVVDGDTHYYELRDSFTRHFPPSMIEDAVRPVRGEDGVERLMVGERLYTFVEDLGDFYSMTVRPGSLRQVLASLSSGGVEENDHLISMQKEFVNRDARVARMDEEGVEVAFLFPTTGVTVEHFLKETPPALYANLRAFNRWLEEDWGYAWKGRIYAAPLLSLCDLDEAVTELEYVLDAGARMISLRPGPAYGRSPADPYFDPFWARVNESRATVAFHIGESGYNELYSTAWGEEANPSSHRQSAFQWVNFYGDRPIMDTLSALVLHNLFGRFPNVRAYSVENGSGWVQYLLKVMDKMNGMGRNGPWIGGRLTERPSNVFKRHVWVSPYHEEPITELVELIGANRVVFGSDFPHAEGLACVEDYVASAHTLSNTDCRCVMRDNALSLVGSAFDSTQ